MLDGRGAVGRKASWRLLLSAGWLVLIALLAIAAPLISPHDPLEQDLFAARMPPFWMHGADPAYLLGTDSLGRDVLSRIIHGSRVALTVALIAGLATGFAGSVLGLLAGYLRGRTDLVISRMVDIWMAFPPVLFAILLIAVLGTGLSSIVIAIVVIDWTRFCRVVRAEAMNQSKMDYIASAVVAGQGRASILWREIGPNVLPTIVALLTLEMGIAVIVEAILSFVGMSVESTIPAWGVMIADARKDMYQAVWGLVLPVLAIIVTVLGFNLLGDGLRRALDPKLRQRVIQ